MKIALLSDLHANRQAVEAVWQHAQEQGFDQLVMLGDYVDYGADPVWVVEFAQAREAEGAGLVRGGASRWQRPSVSPLSGCHPSREHG